MKKLDDYPYRCTGRKVHPCCTSDIDKTVEVVIDNIVKQLAYLYYFHWLIADPQHLRLRPQYGNVLVHHLTFHRRARMQLFRRVRRAVRTRSERHHARTVPGMAF